MNRLLDLAVNAHGGVDRWKEVNAIKVDVSITGAIWFVKGRVDVLKDVVIKAETKRERLTTDFTGQNKRSIFEPDRLVVESAKGETITARDHPRKSFEGETLETPWDDVHVAYFSGEAMWTYLNIPFLYKQPGFEIEEFHRFNQTARPGGGSRLPFPKTSEVIHARRFLALVLTAF